MLQVCSAQKPRAAPLFELPGDPFPACCSDCWPGCRLCCCCQPQPAAAGATPERSAHWSQSEGALDHGGRVALNLHLPHLRLFEGGGRILVGP